MNGESLSRISTRFFDALPRLPAASATRAVNEWVRPTFNDKEGVNLQLCLLRKEALPRKEEPE